MSDIEAENIINLYNSGLTSWKVAEICNRSQSFVIKTLKNNNVPRRTTHSYVTLYPANENFFNEIDTEAKAYILGFLYADGNNYIGKTNHSNEISISLKETDFLILEKIKNLLSPATQLKYKNSYCLLKINSKHISNQLTNLGCVPNKSLILKYPNFISDELTHHFIRGYFDGDGSIYKKTKDNDWGWQITSTNDFCKSVDKIIKKELNINTYLRVCKPETNKITSTLATGGNLQVFKVLEWLYKDATIYLERKFNRYLQMSNQIHHLK